MCDRNITKEIISSLDDAPLPGPGELLQVRVGKIKTLVDEPSGIFKDEYDVPVFVSNTGLVGDSHVYHTHGGTERAVMQYDASHYADWRKEDAPKPELFQYGAFGENLVSMNMTEENVCIGDLYSIGDQVIVQVSEPRHPCYKINRRFEWPRALKRTQRTARVGWLYRVIQTGYVKRGDKISLLARPNPKWSCLNVKRTLQGKNVPLQLLQELYNLGTITEMYRDLATNQMQTAPKSYELVEATPITSRIKKFTFQLKEPITIADAKFQPYAFAKITFGPEEGLSRSYSIVSGDFNRFSLGVALDDHSRGGSAYLHKNMKVGDCLIMTPGKNVKGLEDDKICEEKSVPNRLVIIGGIGVTAFVPEILKWEKEGLNYAVHYAVRTPEEAAFRQYLPADKTTYYAKSEGQRLRVEEIIPGPKEDGSFDTRIFSCGPDRLMDAGREYAESLGYPDHLLHFESFGSTSGGFFGDPFEVEVDDLDSGRKEKVQIPSDKTMLQTLRDAGFEITSSCEMGGCGSCRVKLCEGKASYKGSGLPVKDRSVAMLACVDRGLGPIKIELD